MEFCLGSQKIVDVVDQADDYLEYPKSSGSM